MGIRAWVIQIGEILPLDVDQRLMRSGRLVKALAEAGHEVVWWTSAFDHMSKTWLSEDLADRPWLPGVTIRFLKGCGYRRNMGWRRYADHWLQARHFRRRAGSEAAPDVIIANLPDHNVAYAAASFAWRQRIPFLLDLRDLWPHDIVRSLRPAILRLPLRLLLARDFSKTSRMIRQADAVVTMMAPYWDMLQDRRGSRPNDRLIPLGAPPAPQPAGPASEPVRRALEQAGDRAIFLFIGTMGQTYDPTPIVKAARRLPEELAARAFFILAGDGAFAGAAKAAAEGAEHIAFPGWIGENDIGHLLRAAAVGVVPTSVPVKAMPNKVFTYLSGGLPILSSLAGEFVDLVETEHIGWSISPGDIEAMSETISRLIQHPELVQERSVCAARCFADRFHADRVDADYLQVIERVLAAGASRDG